MHTQGHGRTRRRRDRRRLKIRAAATATIIAALTVIAAAIWSVGHFSPARTEADRQIPLAEIDADSSEAIIPAAFTTTSHQNPIYRYSVIPGGAHDPQELLNAIGLDPVVAEHYRALARDRVRVARLPEERRAYVSYRIGDRVYWTTHRVTLPAGEPILTDGRTQIRARCGNAISYEPQAPTSTQEPETAEFDALAPARGDGSASGAGASTVSAAAIPPLGALSAFPPPGFGVSNELAAAPLSATNRAPGLGLGPVPASENRLPATLSSNRRVPRPALSPVPGIPSTGGGENAPPYGGTVLDDGGPGGSVAGGSHPGDSNPGGSNPGGPNPGGPGGAGPAPGGFIPGWLPPEGPLSGVVIPQGPPDAGAGGDDWLAAEPVQPAPIPEPSTLILVGTGGAGALWRAFRRRRRIR